MRYLIILLLAIPSFGATGAIGNAIFASWNPYNPDSPGLLQFSAPSDVDCASPYTHMKIRHRGRIKMSTNWVTLVQSQQFHITRPSNCQTKWNSPPQTIMFPGGVPCGCWNYRAETIGDTYLGSHPGVPVTRWEQHGDRFITRNCEGGGS